MQCKYTIYIIYGIIQSIKVTLVYLYGYIQYTLYQCSYFITNGQWARIYLNLYINKNEMLFIGKRIT